MDELEIRLRCIEAAAKTPTVHANGHAAGVLEAARLWASWIIPKTETDSRQGTLRLPNKK